MTTDGIQIRWIGKQAVVTLPTEIDASNADAIRQDLLAAAGPDAVGLILDMSQTTFCDSAGVQAIIDTYNHTAAPRLRLVAPAVMRIFTLTGVDQLIPAYATLEAALAQTLASPGLHESPREDPRGAT